MLSFLSILLLASWCFVLSATAFHFPNINNLRVGRTNQQLQYIYQLPHLFSAPAKDSESYNLDAIQDEFIQEQSLKPNNKSYTNKTRKLRNNEAKRRKTVSSSNNNNTGINKTRSDNVGANNKKRRSRRSGSKSASTPIEESSMPPWLSQYEDDNLIGDSYHYNPQQQHTPENDAESLSALSGSKSASTPIEESSMPPWLSQYEDDNLIGDSYHYNPQQQHISENDAESLSALTSFADLKDNFDDRKQNNVMTPMQRLQLAMSGIFYHPDTDDKPSAMLLPNAISYFTPLEIKEVLDAIRFASHSNEKLMAGCADFLYLMLTLEEEGMLTNEFLENERWDDDDIDNSSIDDWNARYRTSTNSRGGVEPHSIMTRDVLIAAAFHYCDCVRARKAGVYEYVRQAMKAPVEQPVSRELEKMENNRGRRSSRLDEIQNDEVDESPTSESFVPMTTAITRRRGKSPIERYGKESVDIAAGAARLKRAEIMVTSVNRRNPIPSNSDAETLRSFLVTLSEDWRGLVIRSAACLYRLKGIEDLPESNNNSRVVLSTTTMRTARDALRVYAPLAQRLGMQRLKSELENTAFRILYPRQYSVASSLYNDDIDEMKAIIQVLSNRIEQLLRSDPVFLDQIDDVAVSSRVKEPYSLWRKMLRFRKQAAKATKGDDTSTVNSETLSMRWIPDAIALRVVLRASKTSQYEDDDSLRTREKMLCYYALQLISDVWPTSAANKPKDYIQNPKENGYQSLHYTANLVINGEDWPFEVQIRSEEMHRIAEYGVAAHWDYKLETKAPALPEVAVTSAANVPILALPAASNVTDTTVEKLSTRKSETNRQSSKSQKKGRIESYIEALTTSRETLVETNLFVFISSTESALDGHLVSIDPSTASIADVLKKSGVEPGNMTSGIIFRNGAHAKLDDEVYNGDVITVH
ncbi:hypothetical protein ACHAWC_009215 [Mediolabrus comicus]